jgi:hypothetical protein
MRRLLVLSLVLCAATAASAAVAAGAVLGPLPANGLPGQMCAVPIVLSLDTAQADRMAFSLTAAPNAEAPALTADLGFTSAAGIPAPGVLEAAADSLVAAWFSPVSPPLTGAVTLGQLLIAIPPEAVDGQSYTVHMVSVGASLDSTELSTAPGADVLVTVASHYTLTVTANPPEGGTVTGSGPYDPGAVVRVLATPNPGWTFLNWTGDPVNRDPARAANTITMDGDRSITANFLRTWFEDDDPAILYTGTWTLSSAPEATAGYLMASAQTGASAAFTFTGTGVKWRAACGPEMGLARVTLDGGAPLLVDLYSRSTRFVTRSKTRLPLAPHTIAIEVSGERDRRSSGFTVTVDAFEVVP